MISGACSDLSVSTYSIPFSSQTMRTAHVYVERAEPMISGFGMPFLRFCRPVTFTRRSKAAPTCDVNLFGGKLAKVGSQFRVKNKTPSSKRLIPLFVQQRTRIRRPLRQLRAQERSFVSSNPNIILG